MGESVEERADTILSADAGYPFRSLGYDAGHYYYFPSKTRQIVSIPVGAHGNKAYMLSLAPLEWWEATFPSKQGVDWTAATNQCMRWCEDRGTFDSRLIRGRGAWFDDGRSVLHLGQYLIVDGQRVELTEYKTKFIYESRQSLEINGSSEPCSADEGRKIIDIAKMLRWERPVNGTLLAGWCYLAPICGALRWRPHIWLTGQKSTGKSYIISSFIGPILGPTSITAQANTTEAGIRHETQQDARPVLLDEAESEKPSDRNRIQGIVELARQASSENSAAIIKGTASGAALSYRVRSMFLFGSINVTLSLAADTSRFTVLSLRAAKGGTDNTEHFQALQSAINQTLTEEFCARVRARAYRDIPVIRKNAATFGRAVAEYLHDQRSGDQYGALLAGAYGLQRDGEISLNDARRLVGSLDWESMEVNEDPSDEQQLLAEILAMPVKVELDKGHQERRAGELIDIIAGKGKYDHIAAIDARPALERCGLKVEDGALYVANNHPDLRRVLSSTPWAGGWSRILRRIDGADQSTGMRFAGVYLRSVMIPLAAFSGE